MWDIIIEIMPLSLLSDNPLYFAAWIGAILIALAIHEFFHAYIAHRLGDDTAESMGRMTLNPLAHTDWLGLLMLVLVGFGWGKPVPVNYYNLKYKKWGAAMVSLAGPLANLIGIVVFGISLKLISIFTTLTVGNLLVQFINLLIIINAVLLVFNLIPIPPLDGSKVLFTVLDDPKYNDFKKRLEVQGPVILIGLLIVDNLFNIGIFSALFNTVVRFVYGFF